MQPSTLPPTASRSLGGRLSSETSPLPPPPPPVVRLREEKDVSSHRDPSREVFASPAGSAHRPTLGIAQESLRTLPRADDGEGLLYSLGPRRRGPAPPTRQPPSGLPNILDSSGTFTPKYPASRSMNPSFSPARYTPPPPPTKLTLTPRVIALPVSPRTQKGINPRAVPPPPSAINQQYAAPPFSDVPVNLARRARTVMLESTSGSLPARTRVSRTRYMDPDSAGPVSCPAGTPLQTSGRVLCVECTTNPKDRKHPFEVVLPMARRRRGNVDVGWALGAKPESERQLGVGRSGRTTDRAVEEGSGNAATAFGAPGSRTGARQGDAMRHSSRKRPRDSEIPPAPGARVDEYESLPSSAEIRQLSGSLLPVKQVAGRRRLSGLFWSTIENFNIRAQRRATDSPTITAGRAGGARPTTQSKPRATASRDRLHGGRLARPGFSPPPPAASASTISANRPALVVFRSTTGPPSPEGCRRSQLAFDAVLANHKRCGTARGADGLGSATEVNARNFEEKRRVKTRPKRFVAGSGKLE